MKANYQFSFNPDPKQAEAQEEVGLTSLFRDLFPYLSLRTVTSALIAIHLTWFLFSISELTLLPQPNSYLFTRNIFSQLASTFTGAVFLGRVGSEYQAKMGLKHYVSVILVLQLLRCLLIFVLSSDNSSLLVVSNSSIVSLWVISLINLQKWKQNQMPQYQVQEKAVENYDLLDLNDTVIKLKPNQSSFVYESYTNREFYLHNIVHREEKSQKSGGKSGKKGKRSSKFIEEVSNEGQDFQLKLFKLIFINFIAFSAFSTKEFLIYLLTEAALYFLFVTKLLKRLVLL